MHKEFLRTFWSSDKVNDLIENIDNEISNGDYTAININDMQGKISLCGVGGSEDDFIEDGFLPKGKYILFRAIKTIEIDENKQWREN
jgi:hypothetical protein